MPILNIYIKRHGENNVEQYFAVNREFGEKLPEVREMSAFMDLQRQYGETLWNHAVSKVEARNAILTRAFESGREALETAFAPAEAAEPKAAKPKAKAKSKPRAKKAAKTEAAAE